MLYQAGLSLCLLFVLQGNQQQQQGDAAGAYAQLDQQQLPSVLDSCALAVLCSNAGLHAAQIVLSSAFTCSTCVTPGDVCSTPLLHNAANSTYYPTITDSIFHCWLVFVPGTLDEAAAAATSQQQQQQYGDERCGYGSRDDPLALPSPAEVEAALLQFPPGADKGAASKQQLQSWHERFKGVAAAAVGLEQLASAATAQYMDAQGEAKGGGEVQLVH
jgi:hypothetical protein